MIMVPSATGDFSIRIPGRRSLAGQKMATQGFRVNLVNGALVLVLLNAQGLTFGG